MNIRSVISHSLPMKRYCMVLYGSVLTISNKYISGRFSFSGRLSGRVHVRRYCEIKVYPSIRNQVRPGNEHPVR